MACCGAIQVNGVCRVCELLDDDKQIKKVGYCEICKVYICYTCNKDLKRRWEAFLAHRKTK
jgi:hypothetical protein